MSYYILINEVIDEIIHNTISEIKQQFKQDHVFLYQFVKEEY